MSEPPANPSAAARPETGKDDNRFYRMLGEAPPPPPGAPSLREEAIALNRSRRLANALSRETARPPEEATVRGGVRVAAKEDLRAAAALLLRQAGGAAEFLTPARLRDRDGLAAELAACGFPEGFLMLEEASGVPAAVVGIPPMPGDPSASHLVGPAVAGEGLAAEARASRLLDRALAACRDSGATRLVSHLPVRETARAQELTRAGFLPERTFELLEARRSAKVRLFKNPRDRIFVLEPGDDLAPALSAHAEIFPGSPRDEAGLREAFGNPATRFLLLLRDDRPAGMLELDFSRPARAIASNAGARPGLDSEGVARSLLAAACRIAFKKAGVDLLEALLEERAAASSGDLAPIGFRVTERCTRFVLHLSPPSR